MSELQKIRLPQGFNYVAAFLTFSCQLRCTYCINHHGGDLVKARRMNGEDWIRGLNRIVTRPDLPVTIQGGEPTTHKDFFKIVNGIREDIPVDLLTNLELDPSIFASRIPNTRFERVAKYASIRVSYHKGQSNRDELLKRTSYLQTHGYSIGIWIVDHPEYREHTKETVKMAQALGIDIRLKEFLGPYKGQIYGTFRYPEAVDARTLRSCDCRTSELIIAPDGNVFRCHSDLYADRSSIGNILDPLFDSSALGQWAPCAVYGKCNSCDIKVKNNRFQEFGHSSVEIRNISEPYASNDTYVEQVVNTYGKADHHGARKE